MKEPIILDSTCLIGLERIGQLDILSELFEPIVIPDEVDTPDCIVFLIAKGLKRDGHFCYPPIMKLLRLNIPPIIPF